MITKSSEANPITITAMAHWGSRTLSSAKPTVGCMCLGNTKTKEFVLNKPTQKFKFITAYL